MPEDAVCLGLCFFGRQLYFAVNLPQEPAYLRHIGAVDFSFNIAGGLLSNQTKKLEPVQEAVSGLADRFEIRRAAVLIYPQMECWATLPKRVSDDARAREAYINILMNGLERKDLHAHWQALSNQDFKLLRLRTEAIRKRFKKLAGGIANVGFSSAFEISEEWVARTQPGGSVLLINTFNNCVSASSFILGKLRGATYICFDNIEDLSYLWLQKAQRLAWMSGLHEMICVSGCRADQVIEILRPSLDKAGAIRKMDSLEKIGVKADEQTYGFDLARAYPAVMMALE